MARYGTEGEGQLYTLGFARPHGGAPRRATDQKLQNVMAVTNVPCRFGQINLVNGRYPPWTPAFRKALSLPRPRAFHFNATQRLRIIRGSGSR
jgi:hypothetical protein